MKQFNAYNKIRFSNKIINFNSYALLAILFSSCSFGSSNQTPDLSARIETIRIPETPRGSVEYVWEEPMVDVVDVPPGLDPEGHYYRKGHQSIVEIRQGRWEYYTDKSRKD